MAFFMAIAVKRFKKKPWTKLIHIPVSQFEDFSLSPLDFKPHIAPQGLNNVGAARGVRNGDTLLRPVNASQPRNFWKSIWLLRNLRVTNPSNYLYFYEFGGYSKYLG